MVISLKTKLVLAAVAALLALASSALLPKPAAAAYDGARIIDNSVFLDAQSMSASDIQNFLQARGSGLANMTFILQCYGHGSQERQWYTAAGAQCDTPIPASQIIYYAAQIYGVNPKVILATMQKEQSLTTAPNPTSWQLNQAMGYACPTSGSCGGNSTFPYQIDSGTWALRFHYERARGNMTWWYTSSGWTCGTEKNFYKPNLYPNQNVRFYDQDGVHYRTYYLQNAATSAFYCYTPHAYNNPQGLYGRAPYGTVGRYYSGSYNFVHFYELWFGTTLSDVPIPEVASRYNALGGKNGALGKLIDSGWCNTERTVCWQTFQNGSIIYSEATGAWESKGGIRERWSQLGYQTGAMGFPTGPEHWDGRGWWQSYENGAIVGSPTTGFWESMGPLRDRWAQINYQSGKMGYPKGKITYNSSRTTAWQEYENGYLYWHQATGAWESKGGIRDYWGKLGYQSGILGHPTGAEVYDAATKTWSQTYQNGTIYNTAARGSWHVLN